MNRGRRKEAIFIDSADYARFLDILADSTAMWSVDVCAYCLMPNHYHLLIHTPEGNLSRFMRHVGAVYTQKFNWAHATDGPLFRGRYKSILVHGDSYLKELVRYIHRNPIGSGLSKGVGDYRYSSHRAYLFKSKKWDWVAKDQVLSMFAPNPAQARGAYKRFVTRESPEKISKIFEGKILPPLLGPDSFLNRIKQAFGPGKQDPEVPQARNLKPEPLDILDTVCQTYHVDLDSLKKVRRGHFNEPRNVAIYLTRSLTRDTMEEVGRLFSLNKHSSVGYAVKQLETRMQSDHNLKTRVEKIREKVLNRQPST